ncbi:WhiB family transcriptional regulator [Rhodococcus qingshengii]|uniref:WhiB family transcriptional regulator n=1 Tax=Rhodococcus qingshengii TaxID=334542 RepID=UPI0028F1846D|nr:WhiB family transcriptional regulator [Rhodococcus qingshengii]MDT9664673.1 WhiB family transcriptional regulator [Rhodococcus qingshengii]
MSSSPFSYTSDVAECVPESDWQSHADCRLIGTAIFFASDNESTGARQRRERTAKEICATCPVLIPCRNYALNVGEQHGIWGGTSEVERRALSKRTKSQSRRG